eukprot:TRINITY_DN23960_c0_g1_i1.p1 TRINITY_DN23960_c0_g1~~TRINITY_DN23960_c0_g1_i1.p1  ORF type:complete len:166 (-),score=29.13 TRINITY_DN23960_c0_g1_i1:30-527(-)
MPTKSTDARNALDILVCIDKYKIGDGYQTRREKVMNYIVHNIETVMESCGWNEFMKKNGETVTEIMKMLVSNSNEKMLVVQNKCECKLRIFVKNIVGSQYELIANPLDKIKQVKEIMQDVSGISPELQKNLIFQNQHLEDDKTLADYKVANEGIIYFIPGGSRPM